MPILIIAEVIDSILKPATHAAVGAAAQLQGPVHVLVMGQNVDDAAKSAAQIAGLQKILVADDPLLAHGLPENATALIVNTIKSGGYTHVLAPATSFGKNLLPRVAALLDVQQISDVIGIDAPDTFRRPIYAGNAIATVKSSDAIKVMTIRTTNFTAAPGTGGTASIEKIIGAMDAGTTRFVNRETSTSERPELTAARIVVSGGRGVGSAENFKIIDALADKLGAAVGASRAAVDAGYVPNDYQVGQTGKIVAPDLYIAVGISGAIQHLAGMKDSKVIVAINKDPDAPIFAVADYGLVADLFTAVPDMTGKV